MRDMRVKNWFFIENEMVDSGTLKNVYQIAVYTVLCREIGDFGECEIGLKDLMKKLNISKPKLISTIKELEESGIISKNINMTSEGSKNKNIYRIVHRNN